MIAEKDKKTLLFLFIIVILVGAYFLAGKFQEDNLAYEEQVKELKAKHSDLNDKNIKQDDNKLEILDNGNKLEKQAVELLDKYNGYFAIQSFSPLIVYWFNDVQR